MGDNHEKIREMEAAMAKAKYNKATEKWFALMKSQIAKLREKIEKASSGGKKGSGWFVRKSGNATVILVGFPSVGKSTLLNSLTGSESKIGAYEFTTLDCIPGTLHFKGSKIQILDVPGIISGASMGRGRGKEVLAMARASDMVLFVIDALHPEHFEALKKEVFDVGIRVNQQKPDVRIVKKSKGGLSVNSTVKLTKASSETFAAVLKEFKIANADVVIRSDIDIDQFIDCIKGNSSYVRGLVCVSKCDLLSKEKRKELKKELKGAVFASAETMEGIEALKEKIFSTLDLVRIYLKEVNKKPDMDEPLILSRPVTLKKVCDNIHRDFVKKFRFARVWGPSAKFEGQQVQNLGMVLSDEDVVEIHIN